MSNLVVFVLFVELHSVGQLSRIHDEIGILRRTIAYTEHLAFLSGRDMCLTLPFVVRVGHEEVEPFRTGAGSQGQYLISHGIRHQTQSGDTAVAHWCRPFGGQVSVFGLRQCGTEIHALGILISFEEDGSHGKC